MNSGFTVISLNVNGLRAFYNRGDGDGSLIEKLINEYNPHCLLFQETKCSNDDFYWWLSDYSKDWWLSSFQNEFKSSYAGVGTMVRRDAFPEYYKFLSNKSTIFQSVKLIDSEYDTGRIIKIDFEKFYLLGVYVLNSGDKDDLRVEWNHELEKYLAGLDKPYIIMGDLNVCSRPQDCWAYDQYFDQVPGVKEYEILHFNDILLPNLNLKDAWSELHPFQADTYSWFSYRGASRYKNQGFRLDYALVKSDYLSEVESCEILGDPCEYSDHNPILLKFK